MELVQNDGNNKSFKMLPEFVPSGCMSMPWVFFSNDYPGLTLIIFMTGSNSFPYAFVWMTAYTALSAHAYTSLSAHVFPSLF